MRPHSLRVAGQVVEEGHVVELLAKARTITAPWEIRRIDDNALLAFHRAASPTKVREKEEEDE